VTYSSRKRPGALAIGNRVEIWGFCAIYVNDYKGYTVPNYQTGESVQVKQELKERVDHNIRQPKRVCSPLQSHPRCHVFIIRDVGVQLFQFGAGAFVAAQLLVNKGTFVAKGAQEFIRAIFLAAVCPWSPQ